MTQPLAFAAFAPAIREASPLRAAITAAYRRNEAACVVPLLAAATLDEPMQAQVRETSRHLVATLRANHKGTGVEGLVHEYSLSSEEGVALMCLAEALLRIPDAATRDALIRDKIARGQWQAHAGRSASIFVNAATWGLLLT
ncbi:MAG: trifunctional transcriptional regulator/proline dehydrogenase/L-glutamate gamma-semialdehyde dehydrogenase, partial [Sphingomonadales bacterium]